MVRLKEETRHLADVLKSLIIVVSVALALQSYPPARQDIVQAEPKPNPFYVVTEPIQALEQPNLPKVEPVATIKPKPAPASSTAVSGGKQDWLRQAGIPESDWKWVDEIINRESTWNYKAVNRSSGATGLCQSLPANKMASAGADYLTNPVTQLKWCHQYAMGYGSWAKAAEYSRCVGNCFSSRANRVVYKDHKWW